MTKLNIHEAKTHLSKYLKRVQAGEIITICKNGEPIAEINPVKKKSFRRFGIAKGLGSITDDFDQPLSPEEFPGFD